MMKPRGLRVAGGSAGCAEGHSRRRGFPQGRGQKRYGQDPEAPESRSHLWWEKTAWAFIGPFWGEP